MKESEHVTQTERFTVSYLVEGRWSYGENLHTYRYDVFFLGNTFAGAGNT